MLIIRDVMAWRQVLLMEPSLSELASVKLAVRSLVDTEKPAVGA